MKKIIITAICVVQSFCALAQQNNTISLDGEWRVALDVFYQGYANQWYKQELPNTKDLHLDYSIYFRRDDYLVSNWMRLPGTMDESNIGVKLYPEKAFSEGLQKKINYDGPFWIQRKVTIPTDWIGKTVIFSMERTIGVSTMYWDGKLVGEASGYEAPQEFKINSLLAGVGDHIITVFVNKNDKRYRQVGHGVVGENGVGWTGVVGRIEMQVQNTIYLKNIQIFPNIENGSLKTTFTIGQNRKQNKDITVNLSVRKKKAGGGFKNLKTIHIKGERIEKQSLELLLPKPIELWSEFTPSLYEMKTEVLVDDMVEDVVYTTFGMRSFATQKGNFSINGKNTFLRRAEYDGASPIKNYPSMEKADWLRLMGVAKEYGLNSLRFHTWCPPKAAFEAADELGLYLQVELPSKWGGDVKEDYPMRELETISDAYGNHPSFCMLTLGNERFTHNSNTKKAITDAKQYDIRHLYTCTSHPLATNCVDDYYEAADAGAKDKLLVGIEWGGGDVVSSTRFNTKTPETKSDYRNAIRDFEVPIVSHEAGQWVMFPNLDEISKYTGVLENTNYERIRESLDKKGMLEYAADFAMASGKFAAILYKEEIESALRTPNFGGISLLGITDFQGQNLAVVGILDSFWESKGIVSPKQHRMYCSPTVPLARMGKRVWKQNETFTANAEIAHFGEKDLLKTQPSWSIASENGKVLLNGQFAKVNIPTGGLTPLGDISVSLNKIAAPQKLTLSIEIPSTEIKNSWDIWVYPSEIEASLGKVKVFNKWDTNAKNALALGENVLLLPQKESLKDGYRESCFTTVFWNSLFKNFQKAHTLGVLCDPSLPLFNSFPTDNSSNWQWWDVTMHANAMYLNNAPKTLKPLVQVIDSYHINDKLAYVWECKVGKGKLLVSTVDFTTDIEKRTVSKQLEKSILDYMNTAAFNPNTELHSSEIENFFK
ncbi:MAG: hypothetical protein K0M50_14885 [Prolixibacteraceae bacterium]|nr:hypothetical protein [Prolixibacteraceae bacterium]